MRRNGPREYMPCLALFMLEAAWPSGVFAPPMPERSVLRSLPSRLGFLGRGARGCLVFGGAVLVVGGAEGSGVPDADGSAAVSGGCASVDSETASGVPGASDDGASMGWSAGASAGVLSIGGAASGSRPSGVTRRSGTWSWWSFCLLTILAKSFPAGRAGYDHQ